MSHINARRGETRRTAPRTRPPWYSGHKYLRKIHQRKFRQQVREALFRQDEERWPFPTRPYDFMWDL